MVEDAHSYPQLESSVSQEHLATTLATGLGDRGFCRLVVFAVCCLREAVPEFQNVLVPPIFTALGRIDEQVRLNLLHGLSFPMDVLLRFVRDDAKLKDDFRKQLAEAYPPEEKE